MSAILTIKGLSVSVGSKELLNIEHLTASSGEFIALLGANGAGKTTLFKSITGEMKSASVDVDPVTLHQQGIKKWSSVELARHMAVLPQSSQLTFPFTVKEVVALGLIPLSASKQEGIRLVEDAMLKTDTTQFSERIYTHLSGGERQRVHLARVLVQLSQAEDKPLLLLDEPTSAQDLGQQHQILKLAQALCHEKGWTVIAILHDLNQAIRYCDQVWLLEQGSLMSEGSPEAVLTEDRIDQVWGYRPNILRSETGQTILA